MGNEKRITDFIAFSSLRSGSETPLILLMGLPGSGKSTLAQALLNSHRDCLLISTDAVRSQLFGNEAIQGSWLKIWLEVRRQFQDAVLQIGLGRASLAIYDATNVVRKQRRQAIDLARKTGFSHITGLWVNTPLSVCLTRNWNRDRKVPEEVILRMNRRLTGAPPSTEEGLDHLIEFTTDRGTSTSFLL